MADVLGLSLIGWFMLFSASYRYAGVIAVVAEDNGEWINLFSHFTSIYFLVVQNL